MSRYTTTTSIKATIDMLQIPCQMVFCTHGWQTSEEQNRGENQDMARSQELEIRRQVLTARDSLSVSSLVQGTPTTSDIPRYVPRLPQFPTVTKASQATQVTGK